MNDKNSLINIFKSCLDILRTEGLTGDKALRNLSYLLILKLIEPRIGNEIIIREEDYNFRNLTKEQKNKLLSLVVFDNLQKEPEGNLSTNIKCMWDIILSENSKTKNIFLRNKSFDIKHQSTYKKLIVKIGNVDFSKMDYDILGNAYEEVIQNLMTGKVLGQFFTQPLVKNIMVKLINPQVFPDGKIESCADPTMGTGGFLISYLKAIKEKAKPILYFL
jgi:type I restriction-modification system DNA methylase subunit